MRQVLNISLPKEMAEDIKKQAKAGGFSVSEFVRAAVRIYQEERLLRLGRKAMKEYRQGKTVIELP